MAVIGGVTEPFGQSPLETNEDLSPLPNPRYVTRFYESVVAEIRSYNDGESLRLCRDDMSGPGLLLCKLSPEPHSAGRESLM